MRLHELLPFADFSANRPNPHKLKKTALWMGALVATTLFTNTASAAPPSASGCQLNSPGNKIQHVVYVQFDNVHFRRDNPNVPSDLEQMPNLLTFLTSNGTLLTNHHTPLIAHTADNILTSLTGVYPDRHGQAVANSYVYFTNPGSSSWEGFESSFTYWTDLVSPTADTHFNLIAENGKNAPAPWVPFTRAGCNVGAVSIADMELENITSDITTVFGAGSPEAIESSTSALKAQAVADFEGIAVHCAAGNALCAAGNNGKPDLLPDEPGSYTGYNALFGHKYVAPVISPSGPLVDLEGNLITDGNGHVGFPGFGPITASQSLGYVAAMQEHGVPVTFAYISDAHDDPVTRLASGPGQADYEARLASYDKAWGEFFTRLKADGIDQSNTLFIVTADENDHFAGGPPTPANCDGINVPCTYAKIGEIDANIASLLSNVDPALASQTFDIHYDMAPAFSIKGNPAPGSPLAREFEVATAKLTAVSPITGNTDQLTRYLVDPVGMKTLHMVTADPQRTPNFIMFGNPDYYFQTYGPDVVESPAYAWNHGGVSPDIDVTWLGLAGPNVLNTGVNGNVWSDHTDIRATLMSLVGLQDDYIHDGRILLEVLNGKSLPNGVRSLPGDYWLLSQAYKQLTAPLGAVGMATLNASTTALSGSDATYNAIESRIASFTARRDALVSEIKTALDNAANHNHPVTPPVAADLVVRSIALIAKAQHLQ
jgi:hypothetical protein